MARTKVSNPIRIATWNDADNELQSIAAKQREITRIELDLTERISNLKQNAKVATETLQSEIKSSGNQLAIFAKLHAEEFGKAKSRVLTHGVIGWRKSTQLKLIKKAGDIVNALLRLGHSDCLKQPPPKLDKVRARQLLTVEEMREVGMELVVKENDFFYDTEQATIPVLPENEGAR